MRLPLNVGPTHAADWAVSEDEDSKAIIECFQLLSYGIVMCGKRMGGNLP